MSKRRVLVIAYYFPPSGGSGVQRALKFVKYLPVSGWQPVVVTVDPESAAYPNLDPEMMADVPAEVPVYKTDSWDPYNLYAGFTQTSKDSAVSVGFLSDKPITLRERFARWLRANVFIPDARVGWYYYALKQARKLIEEEQIDAVFTTGPPHSTHLIGRALSRRYGLPWIADFRDPWVDIDFLEELPMTGLAKRINASLEQSVLDESSLVLTVSPAIERKFAAKTNTTCATIYNGFDGADFQGKTARRPDFFYVSHVGNMNAARNPEVLWRVLAKGIDAGQFPKLKIRLVGNVDASVMQSLTSTGLDRLVEQVPYCPHHEAVQYMKGSGALLLPINRVFSAKGIVTGKLFEYLAAGKPIIGIGPSDGDAANIIDETMAGKMIDYENDDAMSHYLHALYNAWEKNETFLEADTAAIAAYSREGQTAQLAKLLDELVTRK